MALYRVRGSDQNEYGPVVADEISRRIAEERVRAATLLQVAGDTEWRPIGALPEFDAALRRAGPPVITPSPAQPPLEPSGNALGKVIPLKNPKAITAYY